MISSEVIQGLFNTVRNILNAPLGDCVPQEKPIFLPGFISYTVNVTLRTSGKLRASMGATHVSLSQAVQLAASKALGDTRFGDPVAKLELASMTTELWIQLDREMLAGKNIDHLKNSIRLGYHGIELFLDGRSAYYKPSVPVTSTIDSHERLLTKLCRKASLPLDSWKHSEAQLFRSRWLHYVENKSIKRGYVQLECLRNVSESPLSVESVGGLAKSALSRLLAAQKPDGSFIYKYDACRNRELEARINMVRMAGCAYSLSRATVKMNGFSNPALEKAAANAIWFLLKHSSQHPGQSSGIYIAEYDGRGKLGAIALTLLALQFGSFSDDFSKQREQLLLALLSMQNNDGSFQCFVGAENTSTTSHDFYPGEALLALCYEAGRCNSVEISNVVEKSFCFYKDYFTRRPASGFVLWHVDTWSRLHCLLGERHSPVKKIKEPSRYSDFVFHLVDWILATQHQENADVPGLYWGGFGFPDPPTAASSVYLEAVAYGLSLATAMNLKDRESKYRDAVTLGLQFLRRLQFGGDQSFLFQQPALAIGGLPMNLHTSVIRCDHDQHLITATIAALDSNAVRPTSL